MNNENIQSYFTIVLNNINTINSVMELMRSQERTLSHLLGAQQRPIRNVSRSVPVRSTNNAYIPPRTLSQDNNSYSQYYNTIPIPTRSYQPNLTNIARQIINNALYRTDTLTPVIVRPTEGQIENATSTMLFNSITNPYNTTCPITQQVFMPSDSVTRINRCGHLFTPDDLRIWFSTSVICPMCRIDIRDSIVPEPAEQQQIPAEQQQIPAEQQQEPAEQQQEPAEQQQEPVDQIPDNSTPTNNSAFSNYIYHFMNEDINNIISNFNTDISGGVLLEYTFLQPMLSNILNNTTNTSNT